MVYAYFCFAFCMFFIKSVLKNEHMQFRIHTLIITTGCIISQSKTKGLHINYSGYTGTVSLLAVLHVG